MHIAIVVELRLHEELANYASASFLRETGVFLLQSHRYVEGQALTAERRHNCDDLCTLFSRIHTYVYPYTLYSILYLVSYGTCFSGDVPASTQALVELVWEYSAPWGFLDPNIGGGGLSRGSHNINSRGTIKQNFIDEFLSRFVLQWRRQNFGSGETFSKMY